MMDPAPLNAALEKLYPGRQLKAVYDDYDARVRIFRPGEQLTPSSLEQCPPAPGSEGLSYWAEMVRPYIEKDGEVVDVDLRKLFLSEAGASESAPRVRVWKLDDEVIVESLPFLGYARKGSILEIESNDSDYRGKWEVVELTSDPGSRRVRFRKLA